MKTLNRSRTCRKSQSYYMGAVEINWKEVKVTTLNYWRQGMQTHNPGKLMRTHNGMFQEWLKRRKEYCGSVLLGTWAKWVLLCRMALLASTDPAASYKAYRSAMNTQHSNTYIELFKLLLDFTVHFGSDEVWVSNRKCFDKQQRSIWPNFRIPGL